MRSTLKITSKGQVTFRKDVMKQLGVRPGDRITVDFVAPGLVELRPARSETSLKQFVGCLGKAGPPRLSISEIKRISADAWAGKK
jgi:bifunctional DNA-binding transcriptional regulator/antitoxin component of YhaV-PrlF toxin-antitoxin module